MANAYITNTSRFKPFSFQEMLQPYAIYTEAYNKVEDELSNLDLLSADVASKLNNPDDAELQRKALGFQTDLTSTMNELYEKGLNSETRRKLNSLKTRYTKDLNPINEAYKAYQEDQKYLMRLNREHPEMIVEGLGTSVKDYMHGNLPSGISANTDDIYNKSLKAAAGASSRFSNIENPTTILGEQYYQFKTQQGISQDMVEKLRSVIDNPESEKSKVYLKTDEGKALYDIVTERRKAAGYDSFSDTGKNRIDSSILSGIFSGVSYKEDVDRVANKGWKDPNTPPTGGSQLWGRPVKRVEVNPDGTKTSKIDEDINFITYLKENPNELFKQVQTTKSYTNQVGYTTNYPILSQPNLEKLEEISKRYGFEFKAKDENGNVTFDPGVSLDELQLLIEESAKTHQDYIVNVTDQTELVKTLTENVTAYQSSTAKKLGLQEVVNGRIEPEKDKKKATTKVKEWLSSDSNKIVMYKPGVGTVITDGNKTYKLDMSALFPQLYEKEQLIESLVNSERKEGESAKNYNTRRRQEIALATILINGVKDDSGTSRAGYMEDLYRIFNTKVPVQSKTTSKPA